MLQGYVGVPLEKSCDEGEVFVAYLDVPLEVRIKGDRISGLYPQYTPFNS